MTIKALRLFLLFCTSVSLLLSSCAKDEIADQTGDNWGESSTISGTQNSQYVVKLENKIRNKNKTYTWIWSVVNAKPGNGTAGTAQDLQNWGISLGNCAVMGQVISGSTSPDGVTWKNFNPDTQAEVSADFSKKLIMFQQGTVKNQKSYYKLVVSQNYSIDKSITAVYQSAGMSTGGSLTVSGFGCPMP